MPHWSSSLLIGNGASTFQQGFNLREVWSTWQWVDFLQHKSKICQLNQEQRPHHPLITFESCEWSCSFSHQRSWSSCQQHHGVKVRPQYWFLSHCWGRKTHYLNWFSLRSWLKGCFASISNWKLLHYLQLKAQICLRMAWHAALWS